MENQKDERRIKALNQARNITGLVHVISRAYGSNDFIGWLKVLETESTAKRLMNDIETLVVKRVIENHNVPMYKEGGPSRSHMDFHASDALDYWCTHQRPEFTFPKHIKSNTIFPNE